MVYLKKLIALLLWPARAWKEEQAFKKRIKEMRKKDPFIYK